MNMHLLRWFKNRSRVAQRFQRCDQGSGQTQALAAQVCGSSVISAAPEVLPRQLSLLRDTRASEIAEAAMVLPLMFTILLGIFWFGRAYNVYSTITRAAQEGAAVGATSTCGSCGNALSTNAQIANAVTAAMQASKLDPTQIASNALSSPTGCANYSHSTQSHIDIYRNVQLNPSSSNAPQCGVIVTFKYPYQFYLPFTSLNNQRINMTAAAERQMEN